MKPPMKVDKTVKESADTARLHKKFERKLSVLVSKVTPPNMNDAMQGKYNFHHHYVQSSLDRKKRKIIIC